MYLRKVLIIITCASCLIGCGDTGVSQSKYESVVEERDIYKKLYEDAITRVDSIEERVKTIEDKMAAEEAAKPYDYTDDPNTVVVNLTTDNIADYINLVVVPGSNDTFSVATHSLMYDQGYVLVGESYADIIYDTYWENASGKILEGKQSFTGKAFSMVLANGFTSYEQAQEYANKGIVFYNPTIKYTDATLYFQPTEYVGENYLMEDGRRVVYESDVRSDLYFADNSF